MRNKPQKKSPVGSISETISTPGHGSDLDHMNEESGMNTHAQTTLTKDSDPLDASRIAEATDYNRIPVIMDVEIGGAKGNQVTGASGIFNLLATDEVMWWPYRSLSKALLQTQRNAAAYLEANRLLVEGMQTVIRQEQNLAFEISDRLLNTLSTSRAHASLKSDEVSDAFDRAMTGIRELGEAWINTQLRSLDIMRLHKATLRSERPEGNQVVEAGAA
jgi:hypothetical protein